MSRWLLEWGADDVVNVIPIEDHRDHLLSGRCWCGPTLDDDVLVHGDVVNRRLHVKKTWNFPRAHA